MTFTMANLIVTFEPFLYLVVIFLGTVADSEHSCNPRHQVLHAAENRALRNFVFAKKVARSRVICARECGMDERCKSANYYEREELCELSHAIIGDHSEDLVEDQASVYYDAFEDTARLSLADRPTFAASCKKLFEAGYHASGVYTIYPHGSSDDGLLVFCDMETDGGGWTVFQRRLDGSVDFYIDWAQYKSGFGDLSDEFWLGNDNLVTLTSAASWELRVDLDDWDGNTAWAKYDLFDISGEQYILHLGQYDTSSTAGDSFTYHQGMPFSTRDADNDVWNRGNCAQKFIGAWWNNDCLRAHLNGKYYPDQYPNDVDRGVQWYSWKGIYSLKKCSMKIRENV